MNKEKKMCKKAAAKRGVQKTLFFVLFCNLNFNSAFLIKTFAFGCSCIFTLALSPKYYCWADRRPLFSIFVIPHPNKWECGEDRYSYRNNTRRRFSVGCPCRRTRVTPTALSWWWPSGPSTSFPSWWRPWFLCWRFRCLTSCRPWTCPPTFSRWEAFRSKQRIQNLMAYL